MFTKVQVDLTLPNTPNALARISDALRAANINIQAISCNENTSHSTVHLIVDDPDIAKDALRNLGDVHTTEVVALEMKNIPGAMGNVARALGAADINIRNIYASCGKPQQKTSVFVSVDDIDKACSALRGWKQSGRKL